MMMLKEMLKVQIVLTILNRVLTEKVHVGTFWVLEMFCI